MFVAVLSTRGDLFGGSALNSSLRVEIAVLSTRGDLSGGSALDSSLRVERASIAEGQLCSSPRFGSGRTCRAVALWTRPWGS